MPPPDMPVEAGTGPEFPAPPKLLALPILPMMPVLPPLVLLKETVPAATFPMLAKGPEDRLPEAGLSVSLEVGDEYTPPAPCGSGPEGCMCPLICERTSCACVLAESTCNTSSHCIVAATFSLRCIYP